MAAGAFMAALRIPNFLQNLFGEGVLSASFIPVYAKLLAQGEQQEARRVAGVVISLLTLGVSTVVLLGVVGTPAFVDLVAPGFEGETRLLTIQIVRILFPGVGILVFSAWCLGVLNSHRKFFLSYVATVFWNLSMIGTLIFFGHSSSQAELSIWVAWGSVLGSLLQLGSQLPFVFKYAGAIRFGLNTAIAPVREVFRNLGPVLVSRGVVQLSAYIDGMIASFLGAAAVSSLAYAQTIYLLPISLFGMSVAAAELPEMSSSVGDLETVYAKIRARLKSARANIAFFVIPSWVAFLLIGKSIVAILYQSGAFGEEDTRYVWYILMGSVIGLLAATWGRLYSSAFYALRDTKTPLYFAVVRVALTAVLGVLFAFPLRSEMTWILTHFLGLPLPRLPNMEVSLGAVGLTASAGIAGWVEFLLLRRSLEKKVGETNLDTSYVLKIWAVAAIAGLVSLSAGWVLKSEHPIVSMGAFGVTYLALALGLGLKKL